MRFIKTSIFFLISLVNFCFAGESLKIENAWIRLPPPGVSMLVGYFEIKNTGTETVVITGAQSASFDEVSLHETVQNKGRASMRLLDTVEIAPGEKVSFSPGGKHLMLVNPVKSLSAGEKVEVIFLMSNGDKVSAGFVIKEGVE